MRADKRGGRWVPSEYPPEPESTDTSASGQASTVENPELHVCAVQPNGNATTSVSSS
jgi:hypothetical protein